MVVRRRRVGAGRRHAHEGGGMPLLSQHPYKPHDFKLSGLTGISDRTIQMHFGLYQGYVKNTNALTERGEALLREGKTGAPEYAGITRRLGFEYNGMILHEYYFSNLRPGAGGPIGGSSRLGQAIQQSFGSTDTWMTDFRAIGAMRGGGWAVTF